MSDGSSLRYREKALQEYGEFCHRCDSTEGIVVHHRNGDRSDNSLSNLIPLCYSCHRKVHARSDEFPELVKELGYKPRTLDRTTVSVNEALLNALFERKERTESYEDVIWELLEKATKYENIHDEEP